MILINTKTNESYICSQAYAAHKIGVVPLTVSRWRCSGRKVENYNHWTLYFRPQKVLQRSGFAVTPQPKKSIL